MTHAERWTVENLFTEAGEFKKECGEKLDELLDQVGGVTYEGSVWPRWRFVDGSSITARNGLWEVGACMR